MECIHLGLKLLFLVLILFLTVPLYVVLKVAILLEQIVVLDWLNIISKESFLSIIPIGKMQWDSNWLCIHSLCSRSPVIKPNKLTQTRRIRFSQKKKKKKNEVVIISPSPFYGY